MAGRSPAGGDTGVDPGTSVTIDFTKPIKTGATFTLRAGTNQVTGTTALSPDATRLTFDPAGPLTANTTYTATVTGVTSTQDATLPDQTWSFTTAATATESLFTGQTPATTSANDSSSIELGTVFSPAVDGQVTSIRFYKGAGNTGTHTGSIWSATGTKLAGVTFTGETASGWQNATLSTPLAVTAGQTYVVSYLAPNGHYAATSGFFSSPWTRGDLTAPSGNNGRYLYGTGGGFPTNSYNSTNYFVDIGFTATG